MGAFLGPIMAGAIAAHHDWKSFFWLETALSAFSIILIALTFPETKYHRDGIAGKNSAISSTAPQISDDQSQGEKGGMHAHVSESDSVEGSPLAKGRPSRAQWMPFRRPDSQWKMFVVRDTWTPVKVFFNPIILWAGT